MPRGQLGPAVPSRRDAARHPRRRSSRRLIVLLPLLAAGLPLSASAQQPPDSVPPAVSPDTTAAAEPADTTVAVDSVRVRVLEVLERLATPPLPDSLRELVDSVRRPGPRAPSGPDSVLNALLSLPGYQASRYEGEGLEFGAGGEVVLHGSPEARARFFREGAERMELAADSSIIMNDSASLIWTEGTSVFTGREGEPLTSTSMIYHLGDRRGTAYSARTQFAESGNWIVSGDLPSVTPEIVHGAHVGFTSCDLEHPHYHFNTSQIKIVAGNLLVARSVKLYFADVPVFWFPFMFQSIEQGRASGILTPRFSVNDIVRSSAGYSRRISNLGFYWAINDYADASVAMDWWADNYVGVTGTLNYSWLRQFLNGGINFRNFWREDGSTTVAFGTSHNWELDERTRFQMRASYASSTDFVRQNSFDPREVTQSIDSQGGLNRRFDWGNLSLSANRRQFLSDDRVSLTLPSANLSLTPITFFSAPSSRASWYNNIIWTGSGNYTRSIEDRLDQPPGTFSASLADRMNTRTGLSSSLSLGALSLSHSVSFAEAVTRDGLEVIAPDAGLAEADRLETWFRNVVSPSADSAAFPERVDLSRADMTWTQSLSYQQRLVGTTTFTPNLSMSGRATRSNEIPEATSMVSAPTRISFGAGLKTDIYGLWPGVGGFSAIRHKLSPGFDYSYAPAVTQTELQDAVFGRGEFRAKNQMRIRLNQTFEAKVETDDPEEEEGEEAPADLSGEPRRRERAEIVQLLALQTSAVNYDFVRADSLGQFSDGFTTTRLSNSISSDFLRGLQISMDHLLFDDSGAEGEGRRFAPHLSGLDLSFALNADSPPLRWVGGLLGLGRGEETDAEPEQEEEEEPLPEEDFLPASGLDENQVVPGFADRSSGIRNEGPQRRSGGGGWDADVTYSLQRPRQTDLARQMLQFNVRFRPTDLWRASWRTSYDVELGSFNDHMISFTREMHRWEANFDFRRTVTGNWAFRFEVALVDNRDLKFDYQQHDRSSDPLGGRYR